MPLDAGGLQGALRALCDDPPKGAAAAGQAWADAVKGYAAGIVPPSSTVDAAAATLAGALGSAFASGAAAPGMESGFAAFAGTVGGGMTGFTPTPPPGPVGFASQFAGPKPADHSEAAANIAGLIHSWMQTGTATLVAPPNTVTPWS